MSCHAGETHSLIRQTHCAAEPKLLHLITTAMNGGVDCACSMTLAMLMGRRKVVQHGAAISVDLRVHIQAAASVYLAQAPMQIEQGPK